MVEGCLYKCEFVMTCYYFDGDVKQLLGCTKHQIGEVLFALSSNYNSSLSAATWALRRLTRSSCVIKAFKPASSWRGNEIVKATENDRLRILSYLLSEVYQAATYVSSYFPGVCTARKSSRSQAVQSHLREV